MVVERNVKIFKGSAETIEDDIRKWLRERKDIELITIVQSGYAQGGIAVTIFFKEQK